MATKSQACLPGQDTSGVKVAGAASDDQERSPCGGHPPALACFHAPGPIIQDALKLAASSTEAGVFQNLGSAGNKKDEGGAHVKVKGKECVVAEKINDGMQGTRTMGAETQDQPGIVKEGEGTTPSNRARASAKESEAQSLGHSLTSTDKREGSPKTNCDPIPGCKAGDRSTVRLSPSHEPAARPRSGHKQGCAMNPERIPQQ